MADYRVIHRGGQYAIHEVFLNDDGRIVGYSQDPAYPGGESADALRVEMERYALALEQPALEHEQLQSEAEARRQTTG